MRVSLVATQSYFHNVLLLFMETVKAGRKSFLPVFAIRTIYVNSLDKVNKNRTYFAKLLKKS
ncbi:hypothetical protein DN452_08155 [Lactobacillus reuteri]|nr:hypothetical protein [Limosilactobacillus reuteri]MQB87623.1 hypothetical protein [Limosilactobacillus reuteri]